MAKGSGGKGSSGSGSWDDSSGREVGIDLGPDLEGGDRSGALFSGVISSSGLGGGIQDGGIQHGGIQHGGIQHGLGQSKESLSSEFDGEASAGDESLIDVGLGSQVGGLGDMSIGESSIGDSGESSRGGIVAARGTVDGLVIRVDGRVESATLRQALDEFVSARSSFLAGQEVFLEWVGMRPALEIEESLTHLLKRGYGIVVKAVRLYSRPRSADAGLDSSARLPESRGSGGRAFESTRAGDGSSLFEGARSIGHSVGGSSRESSKYPSKAGAFSSTAKNSSSALSGQGLGASLVGGSSKSMSFQSPLSGATLPWDEPDTRLIHANLRSGQKIESEHSLVIVGDVNSGAEVISGGDVVILGTLRGVAHAGAYEESGGGRVIFSINMQPTQLRIGSVISRGSAQDAKGVAPEVARVDGSLIVVEPYQTKTLGGSAGGGIGSSLVGLLGRRRASF